MIAKYGLAALCAALALAGISIFLLRANLETTKAELAAARAGIVMMQEQVVSCRDQINIQNAEVQRYRVQAEEAHAKAAQSAKAALKAPRRPLEGHGPVAMNSFFEAVH